MPALTFEVPEAFGGKSLRQLRGELSDPFRSDIIANMFGIQEDTPFEVGQSFTFQGDPGSAETQFIQNRFAPGGTQANKQAESQAAAITERENQFVQGFKDQFPDIVSGLESDLGLPQLRDISQAAGSNLRQVQNVVSDIPDVQRQATQGFDVTQNQQDRIIASELNKARPTLETARRTAEDAAANQNFAEGQFSTRLNFALQPFEVEKAFLSVQGARDFDLIKNKLNADLTREMQNLQNMSAIELQKLAQSGRLQEMDKAAELSNGVSGAERIDLGDRIAFVNPLTGQQFASFNKGLSPIRGGSPTGESDALSRILGGGFQSTPGGDVFNFNGQQFRVIP